MIFKSLGLQKPLHLYFWNHKNLRYVLPAGAFGAVRPVGAILPTATAAGPFRSRKPRTATPLRRPLPASHLGMMIFQWLVTPICHWPKQKVPNDDAANYDVSRQTGLHLRDKSPRNCGVVLRHLDQSHLIFDPLDNRNLALRINYQRVGLLKESQEVVSKWGLGRSV